MREKIIVPAADATKRGRPIQRFDDLTSETIERLFSHRSGLFAFTATQVVKLGPTGGALLFHLYFRDPRRMKRKNAFDAFAVRNSSNGERLVESAAFPANHDP